MHILVVDSGSGADSMSIYAPNEEAIRVEESFGEADKAAMCPECNSEVQKLISGFACKTGSYIQASLSPSGRNNRKRGGVG